MHILSSLLRFSMLRKNVSFVFLKVFSLCQFLIDSDSKLLVLYERINEYWKKIRESKCSTALFVMKYKYKKERETDDQTKSESRYFYDDDIWSMRLYQGRYWKFQCSIWIPPYLITGIQHLKASSCLGTSSLCTHTHTNTMFFSILHPHHHPHHQDDLQKKRIVLH